MRLVALTLLCACGAPSSRAPSTKAGSVTPANPSLERIERIARACAPVPDTTPAYITASLNGRGWRSQVRLGERELAIDPAASTCDGVPFTSEPQEGDRSLDEVVAIARDCHHERFGEVWVTFTTGPHAAVDRARFTVGFVEPGPARTFPGPTYVVDPAGKTCGAAPGPQL